jgi:hypothetical protein
MSFYLEPVYWVAFCWVSVNWVKFFLVSAYKMPLCLAPVYWVSFCRVSVYKMSLCLVPVYWVSFCWVLVYWASVYCVSFCWVLVYWASVLVCNSAYLRSNERHSAQCGSTDCHSAKGKKQNVFWLMFSKWRWPLLWLNFCLTVVEKHVQGIELNPNLPPSTAICTTHISTYDLTSFFCYYNKIQ